MATKYDKMTSKELAKQLKKSEDELFLAKHEVNRLANLLAEVEPALASANEAISDLSQAKAILVSEKTELQSDLNEALENNKQWQKLSQTNRSDLDRMTRDFNYENARRTSAENKLFDLEKRLHQTVRVSADDNFEIIQTMVGIRIDRNGNIA